MFDNNPVHPFNADSNDITWDDTVEEVRSKLGKDHHRLSTRMDHHIENINIIAGALPDPVNRRREEVVRIMEQEMEGYIRCAQMLNSTQRLLEDLRELE